MTDSRSAARQRFIMSKKTTDAIATREAVKAKTLSAKVTVTKTATVKPKKS